MPKNNAKHIYSPLTLQALGFVHQYDSDIENKGHPDEFSYSLAKLYLNKEAYLECTTEFDANNKPRLQYFSLNVDDFEIKKTLTPDDFVNLKQIFKP